MPPKMSSQDLKEPETGDDRLNSGSDEESEDGDALDDAYFEDGMGEIPTCPTPGSDQGATYRCCNHDITLEWALSFRLLLWGVQCC